MNRVSSDDSVVRCAECSREVDEFTAIAEKWGYWSDGDGDGELVPFCPECARRAFGRDAPAAGRNEVGACVTQD